IPGDPAGAANTGNQRQRLQVDLGVDQGAGEGVHRRSDAATRAPDMRHAVAAQKRFYGIHSVIDNLQHRLASTMALRISSGWWTPPPAWGTAKVFALPPAARSISRTICPRLSSGTTKLLTRAA